MSDYSISDDENDYYDDEDMYDGTQEESKCCALSKRRCLIGLACLVSDVEMDGFNEVHTRSGSGKRKAYEIEYDSLSQSAVEKLMQSDIDHVCGILGVDVSLAFH